MICLVRRFLAWFACVMLVLAAPVAAHLTPNSEVGLSIGHTDVHADIIIPQSEYMVATSLATGNDKRGLARAKSYLEDHFKVVSPDGRPWSVRVDFVEFAQIAGPPDLHATAILTPPGGASPRRFIVEWSAVTAELPSHFAMFVIRSDIAGVSGAEPTIAGAARAGAKRVFIDAGDASRWRELRNSITLGMAHILGGYDHLMFLLALLLPAPLIAYAGRWTAVRDRRSSIRRMIAIITAFTIGHSLTLIGASLMGWRLPVQPVEVAIAVSVLISAAHAVRPLFPGYEPLVAGGFGLVHGLAFATLVAELHLGSTTAPVALLGFNLGIEIVQLAIVTVILPPLMLIAGRPYYRYVRVGLGCLGILAATAWVMIRLFGIETDMPGFGWSMIIVLVVLLLLLLTMMVKYGARRPAG